MLVNDAKLLERNENSLYAGYSKLREKRTSLEGECKHESCKYQAQPCRECQVFRQDAPSDT